MLPTPTQSMPFSLTHGNGKLDTFVDLALVDVRESESSYPCSLLVSAWPPELGSLEMDLRQAQVI